MIAAIASELRKIRSTRMWWILLIVMIVTVATFAGFIALVVAFAGPAEGGFGEERDAVTMVYTMGVSLGYVFPLVFGALQMTSEFRHRTIDATLLFEPSRLRVIIAKFIAVIPYALIFGVAAMLTGIAVGAFAFTLGDIPLFLDDAEVWRSIGLGVAALATWSLVGVGFGTALTNQVVVIVFLLGWTQFVEPLLRFGMGFVESLHGVGAYLPGAAGEALVGTSFYAESGLANLLPPWGGFLVLIGYAVVAAGIGWLTTFRKDIS